MSDQEIQSIHQLKADIQRLIAELEKWGYRPYRRDRNRMQKRIRTSSNFVKLKATHDDLDERLQAFVLRKMSENL